MLASSPRWQAWPRLPAADSVSTLEANRINAIAIIRWIAKTFTMENVPKVAFTRCAANLDTSHSKTAIFNQFHFVAARRLPKGGPTASGVELI